MSSRDAHEVWLPRLLQSRKITTNSRLGWHPLWLFDLLARMRDLLGSCVRDLMVFLMNCCIPPICEIESFHQSCELFWFECPDVGSGRGGTELLVVQESQFCLPLADVAAARIASRRLVCNPCKAWHFLACHTWCTMSRHSLTEHWVASSCALMSHSRRVSPGGLGWKAFCLSAACCSGYSHSQWPGLSIWVAYAQQL